MQRHEGTLSSDGNVLYLDWEKGGYINAYIKHNTYAFYCMCGSRGCMGIPHTFLLILLLT